MQEEVALQRQEVTARFNTEQTIRAKMHSSLDAAVSFHQDAAPEPRSWQTVVIQTYQQFTHFLIFLCKTVQLLRAYFTSRSLNVSQFENTLHNAPCKAHFPSFIQGWCLAFLTESKWCTQHLQAHTCALQSKRKKKESLHFQPFLQTYYSVHLKPNKCTSGHPSKCSAVLEATFRLRAVLSAPLCKVTV